MTRILSLGTLALALFAAQPVHAAQEWGLPNEEVARLLWHDTARALGFPEESMPPVRVIKEKRATFAQTPDALARRAQPRTARSNLLLAGDWTDTGYPATIESAVRSGRTAARLVLEG